MSIQDATCRHGLALEGQCVECENGLFTAARPSEDRSSPVTGSEKSRRWDKRLTMEAIAAYSDEVIAKLFWIGHEMEKQLHPSHADKLKRKKGGSSPNDVVSDRGQGGSDD